MAIRGGRSFIGIEKHKPYFEKIAKPRIEAIAAMPSIFDMMERKDLTKQCGF